MELVRRPYHFLKYRVARNFLRGVDFRRARRALSRSDAVSEEHKRLLASVSLRTHLDDRMYTGSALQYLSVGLSALDMLEIALRAAGKPPDDVRTLLDFPCGYGRVLRFLRARFPAAVITAAEVDPRALEFCSREFAVRAQRSGEDFAKLTGFDHFDVIWCGSLVTHVDSRATGDLLRFFHDHLSPGGVCVVTTHGERAAQWIENGTETYLLSAPTRRRLLREYRDTGAAYADYENRRGYGVSLISQTRMLEIAAGVGNWSNACYLEHGWLDHQDVYGFAAPTVRD